MFAFIVDTIREDMAAFTLHVALGPSRDAFSAFMKTSDIFGGIIESRVVCTFLRVIPPSLVHSLSHTLITFLQICKSCNSIFNKPDRTSEISVPLLSFTCSLGMCLENFFKTETLEDHYR